MIKEYIETTEDKMRGDYARGDFLPEAYKQEKFPRPQWLEDNLSKKHRLQQEADLEDLEQKIIAYKNKLGI